MNSCIGLADRQCQVDGRRAYVRELVTARDSSNVGTDGQQLAENRKVAKAKKAPKAAAEPGTPREGSKTSQVIAMLKTDSGTTLEEIMAKMGWLKHTTRAMLSAGGSLTKKHGLVVVSEKVGEKRVYRIAK